LFFSSPVPLFLWTGQPYFSADHAEVSHPLNSDDFQTTLLHLFDDQIDPRATLSSYLSDEVAVTPEVVVAFIASKLGSSQASQLGGAFSTQHDQMKKLKTTLAEARSSLTLPFLYSNSGKFSSYLNDAVSAASPGASTLSYALEDSCETALGNLQQHPDLFSNNRLDLVTIYFSDYQSQQVDDCVSRLTDYVKTQSSGKYLALLSAEDSNVQIQTAFSTVKEDVDVPNWEMIDKPYTSTQFNVKRTNLMANSGNSTTGYTGPQYITPAIMFGILLGFCLLFFLWTGISNIATIEAPVRFSHHKLQLAKEY